ncbi:MAG: hypothetical protein IJG07_09180 [Prevotella sp.]|nr:hypothetical protein [Prevotella sp.]
MITIRTKNAVPGRIKRREYLMYLVAVRDREYRARQMNLNVRKKRLREIRAEFEAEHGSIYMEF